MDNTLRDAVQQVNAALCAHYEVPLRLLARRAVKVWFNRERLDLLLTDTLEHGLQCDLLYAINPDGLQLSSNVYQDHIDPAAYGQDLSQRPYSVTTAVLNNAAYRGVFLCDVYVSQVTRRQCITLMCGVTSGPTTLGFIAADLDLQNLPALQG